MKPTYLLSTLVLSLSIGSAAYGEQPEHFKGKTFTELSQAVAVFNDYNQRFEDKLNGELDSLALHEIHELTYTMEDALAFITSSMYTVAEDLEAVHQATEYANADKVRESGARYLNASRQIIK
ncbi:hypothetical protein A3742_01630 [Oleiphilus sp. HI0071]|uniref:DUF6746 family protein n=1 Tax=unclassified Oleiphilus TaxID=2631174 RepID=UPI0007C372D5|nr:MULTISPECIES: DUF6746 family protein [unclassified Oleiphilus]KZY64734.1 hypothetical protein A3737_14175 [Oleiphilus sp. HI0065]KZY81386.1 hypothetical protein A3742_01630 [Oleiphilus sp. HI0071]KZY93859.1 hypothetical protein A3744_17510 [Oleiphilus sp. HI0073]KZZ43764.1 hypothetical protein A3758_04050 [Oleiphilus sp. HI0118]KZZ56620.1 hypothetical protein A3760_08210 [Oleiphilus sp. HI0122]KZZ71795.1 hypothetical protein A3765_00235 [Oleiphilus sp. HI0130]KZZ80921.1 hypothetical prote